MLKPLVGNKLPTLRVQLERRVRNSLRTGPSLDVKTIGG